MTHFVVRHRYLYLSLPIVSLVCMPKPIAIIKEKGHHKKLYFNIQKNTTKLLSCIVTIR